MNTVLGSTGLSCRLYKSVHSKASISTCINTKAGFRISCVATGSQCKCTTNARIEPSSILAFARTFTLTSGHKARYSEPA